MNESRLRLVTRSLRTRAPRPAVALARRLLIWWGMATAPWRMEPAFLVVGAQRAGTTTLYRVLNQHPEVIRPTAAKGIGYFDDQYQRGPRWYRAHFPLRLVAARAAGRRAVTYESGGYYLWHPLAAERIARDLPKIKVIAMVRDPVERAYSAFKHESARGYESETFERALGLEDERLAGEAERLRADPSYRSFHHRHHAYRGRSRYSEQLDTFIELLGPDRVHIADADEFFHDPVGEFARVQEFLGLSEWAPREVERWNARPGSPLDATLVRSLHDYFEPYDRRLEEQMGRTPRWRRD